MNIKPTLDLDLSNSDEKVMLKSLSINKSKINGNVAFSIVNSNSTPQEKIEALLEENRELREYISKVEIQYKREEFSDYYIMSNNFSEINKIEIGLPSILNKLRVFKSFINTNVSFKDNVVACGFCLHLKQSYSQECLDLIQK